MQTIYQAILAIITFLESELLVKDAGDIAEFLSNIKEYFTDPGEFVKTMLSFKIKKTLIKKLENEYETIESQSVSPIKEKLSTGGDESFKLPPLKVKALKVKIPEPTVKSGHYLRTLSGNFSPSNKPTTVPNLPDIRRNSMKRKSFGLTNKSCDISINPENFDL